MTRSGTDWRVRSVLYLLVLFLTAFSAAILTGPETVRDDNDPEDPLPEQSFQGLPAGISPDSRPDAVTGDWVYFSDRILRRETFSPVQTGETVRILKDIFRSLPQGVRRSLMVVPGRIGYENGLEVFARDMWSVHDRVLKEMEPEVTVIRLDGVLGEKREEYLYYRTDDAWTALGAYYGAVSYLQTTGAGPAPDLSSYLRREGPLFRGARGSDPRREIPPERADRVDYYTEDTIIPWAEVLAARNPGYPEISREPVLSAARGGTDLFVGGRITRAVLRGKAGNGRSLLLAGDTEARILAPWLLSAYDRIDYIHTGWYREGPDELARLMEEAGTDDYLLVLGVHTLNREAAMHQMERFMKLEGRSRDE